MYELWQVDRAHGTVLVAYLGRHKTVREAKAAAKRHGPGRYRVCDGNGDVCRMRVRERHCEGA